MHLRIASTGVRNGEYITSAPGAKQNTGTVMRLRTNNMDGIAYPPLLPWVANLDLIEIRDQLRQIPFFAPMTEEQRLIWLRDHGNTHKDLYMDDVKGLQVRFIKIGGKFMLDSLSTEQIDTLLRGNPRDAQGFYPIEEVVAMFPRKTGRGMGGKSTLVFRPNNWVILPDQETISSFNGLYLDIDTLTLRFGIVNKPAGGDLLIIKLSKQSLASQSKLNVKEYALSVINRTTPLTWISCLSLVPQYVQEIEKWRPIIAWASPALLKSIIQKIIRTRCTTISCGEGDNKVQVSSAAALLTAFFLLLLHAGSFVPNIQRFVSGTESAFKRGAVSIFEDSYMEDGRALMGMLACGQLAQHYEKWQPTDIHIINAIQALLAAQKDRRIFEYDTKEEKKELSTSSVMTSWSMSALLLSELKSFESDISMLDSIARNEGKARLVVAPGTETNMDIIHAVDHHTWTEIAHYIPIYKGDIQEEYKDVFNSIWHNAVGINPRRNTYPITNLVTRKASIISHAQRMLWIVKAREAKTLPPQIERPIINETINFTYELPTSWLAGLIGHIETRAGIAVLGTDDILRLIAIRRPSRDAKDKGDLTEEEKTKVIAEAKEKLVQGIQLRCVPETFPQLNSAIVYLKDIDYELQLTNGTIIRWNDFCHMSFHFPLHPPAPASLEQALTYDGIGIMKGAHAAFDRLLGLLQSATLSRLLTYLVGSHSIILLNKIGRDGNGVDYTVTPEDTNVNYILGILCCLYPGALIKSGNGFIVKNGPLLWWLREKIQLALLTDGVQSRDRTRWGAVRRPQRALWEHQIDSLNDMKERHLRGYRFNALWLEMGLGKTGIAIEYLVWLIESNRMYEYCIVTVPPSAVDSWIKELDFYNIPHQVLDMRTSRARDKATELKGGIVNIVWHDHLRLGDMPEQLKKKAPYALFIVDEFHKTMAHTIRSSLAIEAARLSADCLAMTGTLIRGTDNKELIPWLEQVVEFEVTTDGNNNLFTAIGALISRKATTKVIVERKNVEAQLTNPSEYYSLVPKNLGGTAVRINFRAALDLSYAAADAEVLRLILYYTSQRESIFVIARTGKVQEEYKNKLEGGGVRNIYLIGKGKSLTMGPEEKSPYSVIITTPQYAEGYSLSNIRVSISTVFLSNQATRSQLDARLNRGNQKYPSILLITVHGGILTYIMKKYEEARSLAAALKGLAQDIGETNIRDLLS